MPSSSNCRDVNEESKEEKLLSTLQRCFKSIDKDECGFIGSGQLVEVSSIHSTCS
jgi:hypothetical protein